MDDIPIIRKLFRLIFLNPFIMYNNYNDVQSFEALENERTATMLDPQYQNWVSELRVSQSYVEPEGAIRAKQLNDQYDFSTTSPKSSFLNFLKIKGIW